MTFTVLKRRHTVWLKLQELGFCVSQENSNQLALLFRSWILAFTACVRDPNCWVSVGFPDDLIGGGEPEMDQVLKDLKRNYPLVTTEHTPSDIQE